jgi:uncharacterized protein (DUF924 family)
MTNQISILSLSLVLSAGSAATLASGNATDARADSRPIETPEASRPPPQALDVIAFWRDAGPQLWFAKDPEFDRRFRERYGEAYERAANGELTGWESTPLGALALVLLLDQYPRNSFRGSPRMYATDSLARQAASAAVDADYVRAVSPELRRFFVLPFAHSEDLADQERSVALARELVPEDLARAQHHRDIVMRFGRFPHRNEILGRTSTQAEREYLLKGGYTG